MINPVRKPVAKKMKVLIGTPIHQCKDYAIEKWLENVSRLEYPADLLMVDNSPDASYLDKVRKYCAKYKIRNYQLEHLKINKRVGANIRIESSQEVIRRHILSHNYDCWFSWECDQIIPIDALNKLIKIMQSGNFMMVNHNSWQRLNAEASNTDMGCTLITKECLKKYWIDFERNGKLNFEILEGYQFMFKEGVVGRGGNFVEVYGIINPIYHLSR